MAQEISLKFNAQLGGGAKAVFSSLSNGLKQVAKGFQVLAKEQIKLGNKGTAAALNETAKGLKKYTKEIDKTVVAQNKLNKSSKKTKEEAGRLTTAFSSLGRSIQTYSRYMVASNLILGVIGGFQNATKAVIEYDQALHDLKAITLSSSTETDMMGEAIVRVAKATKFSMGEVGGAMKRLAQAGFSATEVTSMIGPIAELATGSLETLDVTVKLVSTAIRVFGMSMNDTKSVVDIFSNAVNKSRLTISGLNTTFNYIGPIAAATGLSLKDTSASMMLLANSGLRFSTIGTGLRRIIGGLAKPSGRFRDAILAAGYTLADFNPNVTEFRDILQKLPNVIKDSTDAIEFFGYRGSSVISAFATQGVSEYDRLRSAVNRVGTTSEMAAEQMKGLQNAIKNIKDRFGVLSKTLAEGGFLTIIKAVVGSLRALLSVLIALAGNPLGQAVISFTLLAGAITGVTVAIAGLKAAGLGVFFTKWAVAAGQMVGSLAGVQVATTAAAGGVLTFGAAIKGLGAALATLMFNPVVLGIAAVSAVALTMIAVFKANQKSLRDTAIEQEKYSSSLSTVSSKLEAYKRSVEQYGEGSKESSAALKGLNSNVKALGEGYSDIAGPLSEFTKRVDENSGTILGSKDAIAGLENVINMEYKKSALKAIAASEKMTGVMKGSSTNIRQLTEDFKNNKAVTKAWADGWKSFMGKFGATFSTDSLDMSGIDNGIAQLENLEARAEAGSDKAKESLKTFKHHGEQILDLLEKSGITKAHLAEMSEAQVTQEIINLGQLTYAHRLSSAAAIKAAMDRKQLTEGDTAKSAEVKRLKEAEEAYNHFSLSIEGSSHKLRKWVNNFNALLDVSGKQKVSSQKLVESFKKVGAAVKNTKDFEVFTTSMNALRDSGRLTATDLMELQSITETVFAGIKTSAEGMRDVLNATLDEYYQRVAEKAKRDLTTGSTDLKKQYDEKLRFITDNYKVEDTLLTLKHQAYMSYYSKLSILEQKHSTDAEHNINAAFERKKQALLVTETNEKELNKKLDVLEKDRLKLTIENLDDRKESYAKMIDVLLTEEERLTDKIKSEKEARKTAIKNTEEMVRNLQYKTMTTEQKIIAEKNRLNELHQKAKSAYYVNDYKEAKKLLEETQKGYDSLAGSLTKKGGSEAKYFSEIYKYQEKIKTIGKELVDVYDDSQRATELQKLDIVDMKKELESSKEAAEKSLEETNALFDELVTGSVKKILELNKNISDINDIDVSDPMNELKDSTNDTLKAVDLLIAALKKAASIKPASGTVATGYKDGGSIPGYGGGDTVPANLEKGEFVLKKESVKKYGVDLFQRFNQGLVNKVRAFSSGGVVPKNDGVSSSFLDSVNKSMPSLSSVAGAIQSGFNNVKVGSEMGLESLKDFGRLKLQTNDSEFSVIAHKDVVSQLNSHLQEVRRFAT